jgi:hypothetical protein
MFFPIFYFALIKIAIHITYEPDLYLATNEFFGSIWLITDAVRYQKWVH